jgi:adenylylsulfate kinase
VKHRGFTVWFVGMPFSGKKQLASMLSAKLESLGFHNEILEGGKIRREFDQGLGFTKQEIYKNLHRICFECNMLSKNDIVAIAVTISPYQELREKCRKEIKDYVEVFCTAPLEVLKKRDNRNFYRRAEQGKIQNVAGISTPFDEPVNPDVIFRLDKESFEKGLKNIIETLQARGLIPKKQKKILTEEEERLIRQRLKNTQ